MTGYTKLFSSILMSSVWEESAETRLVWVTMLALADQHGHVDGTVKSLARVSRVTVHECQKALECLLGPDVDDRSGVLNGRRIVAEQGGWSLVNYSTYRQKMSVEDRRERDRIRKRNARMSAGRPQASENVRDFQQAEAEAEAKADTKAKAEKKTAAAPLIMSPAEYARKQTTCAFVGSRLEVPLMLHSELRKLLGGADADRELMAWYDDLNADLEGSGDAITPDVFRWLKARYAKWKAATSSDSEAARIEAWGNDD